jgi:8-oxo-dGTP pyrophosphatase MutT (NUDIX family)
MARGGQQVIPRPSNWRPGEPNPWLATRDESWRYSPDWVQTVVSRITDSAALHTLPTTPYLLRGDPSGSAPVPPLTARSTPYLLRGDPSGSAPVPPLTARSTPVRPPFVNTTKESGVLAPLFLRDDELRIVLTRRDARLRSHKGEVAFPGGRLNDGESAIDAALREAHEEVALPPERVRIFGQIESLTTVISAAKISPFIGFIDGDLPVLVPNPGEVDRIFDVSLYELTHPDTFHEEVWEFPDGTFPVWFFDVEDDTIWGATGRMLRRLLDLMLLSPA